MWLFNVLIIGKVVLFFYFNLILLFMYLFLRMEAGAGATDIVKLCLNIIFFFLVVFLSFLTAVKPLHGAHIRVSIIRMTIEFIAMRRARKYCVAFVYKYTTNFTLRHSLSSLRSYIKFINFINFIFIYISRQLLYIYWCHKYKFIHLILVAKL